MWLGSTYSTVVTWSDTQVVAAVASGSVSGVARIQQNGAWSNAMTFTVPTGGTAMTLVPNIVTPLAGDTRTLQALDDTGQPVTGLTWTSSDTNVVTLSTADPPELTAVAAGHATITAGTASADVTVVAGTLPFGTVVWSNPGTGGGVYKIVPAVPSPTGLADVFSFQNDSTVQAITSEGKTAWTADVSDLYTVLPDFQGGLVGSGNNSIVRIDGRTGQRTMLYTPSGDTAIREPLVHTDGTAFTVRDTYSNNGPTVHEVIGLDPDTGTLKFTVPIFASPHNFDAVGSGAIIAGDGYAYVPYQTMRLHTNNVWHPCDYHIGLKRISSSGAYSDIPVHDWTGECNETPGLAVNMITNADTGVLMSWMWSDWHYETPTEYLMAVTNGTSASVVNAPQLGGDGNWPIAPMLQTQDGWFVGNITDGSYNNHMVAFEANGSIRWIVPGYQPKIATEDGGVIATADDGTAVTFDSNGNATGQMASLLIESWPGNLYAYGSVHRLAASPYSAAASFAAFLGANKSGNNTPYGRVPTTLVIAKEFGVRPKDCYSSVKTQSSVAERDITYEVKDQYRGTMPQVQILEKLIPIQDSPCPTGTHVEGGLCAGDDWKDKEFRDSLSTLVSSHLMYTQMFWVATKPGVVGYRAFYGQILIDAYQPEPSLSSSLDETQEVITVNGNTGMNRDGTPRRCIP